MSKSAPTRYRTTNWSAYNAALRRRGSLLVWLDREMEWLAPASGRPGRPQMFSDAAIQFCLSLKVLFGLALRQTIGMVASPARRWRAWTGRYRITRRCAGGRRPSPSRSPFGAPTAPSTCWSTARA